MLVSTLLKRVAVTVGLLTQLLPAGSLRAQTFPRQYWEANGDSLRQVLDTQRTDTARLRTLLHLDHIFDGYLSEADFYRKLAEKVTLTRRLRRPEAPAFRLWQAGIQLNKARLGTAPGRDSLRRGLDSLQAAVVAFDRLGWAIEWPLSAVSQLFAKRKQPAARIAWLKAKAAQYQASGSRQNLTYCHFMLGYPFANQGDYNQSISHYLRAADLASSFDRYQQHNHLTVVGYYYAEWGNPAQALRYLRQALAVAAALPRRDGYDQNAYTYWGVAKAYRQLRDYPAALRAADQSLAGVSLDTTRRYAARVPEVRAYGLTLKSAVLLDMGRGAEAAPLLARAQQLADSLKLGILNSGGAMELDATWARYYAARGEPARAEKAWLTAYNKAQSSRSVPLRLAYLRALTDFYARRGQAAPAGRYARTALALSDSLRAGQGTFNMAGYEAERVGQAQQQRIAALRETQLLEAARARRQRRVLWATLAGLALLAGLGFVLWRSNRQKQQANTLLDNSLTELRATQAQLIQKEKMASLGELTAGIAHEIQNPLNFVNNFSEVSAELMLELEEAQAAGDEEEAKALAADVRQNLVKITQHGQRAAGIVKGMLEHSSSRAGEREATDLNRLCDEYLRLAYQGLRAKDKSFNAALNTDFMADLPLVTLVGADVGRVLLNLFTNAFYAVRQRQQQGEPGYQPQVGVRTLVLNQQVQIQVTDNGTGMSDAVQGKIFQPFFTTKPTGEGTGLGLSLSHDIIAQGHGGSLTVESQEGEGTAFTISLPG
ncbi:ATP-binding protein [Hymenobacter sp. BT770]|uniref:ATP-binding protein n=1 Tax=Hymenobacter sp. BT770 TaxID=2886942 RepID=UPI001D128C4B|nr:ATP-binding protein [Hymenobacter sp. BT770]MCC3154591.1 histidine kinase [Hymenobacter sp. BT770]MDO3416645.1 ATP-binding protein [Hymenobacter sp. BT770]